MTEVLDVTFREKYIGTRIHSIKDDAPVRLILASLKTKMSKHGIKKGLRKEYHMTRGEKKRQKAIEARKTIILRRRKMRNASRAS